MIAKKSEGGYHTNAGVAVQRYIRFGAERYDSRLEVLYVCNYAWEGAWKFWCFVCRRIERQLESFSMPRGLGKCVVCQATVL